nr:DUF4411 family protein [Corynebacterium phocae]
MTRYLLDTNIVINGFNSYPPDIFPGYWQLLEYL